MISVYIKHYFREIFNRMGSTLQGSPAQDTALQHLRLVGGKVRQALHSWESLNHLARVAIMTSLYDLKNLHSRLANMPQQLELTEAQTCKFCYGLQATDLADANRSCTARVSDIGYMRSD